MIHDVVHAVTDPWSQAIMRRAFAEVALLGIAGGLLGCWTVAYNLSYSAESLAHTLLPGLVLASLAGVPLLIGGAAGIIVGGLAVALAARTPSIGRDTAVAVVVSTLFGLGVLLALSPRSPAGLQGLLFGDVLGASNGDLIQGAVLVALVVVALWFAHGRLLLVGFDRSAARELGVNPVVADAALLVLLALTILVCVQGLGTLLVVAILVAPAAAARTLAIRMSTMLWISAIGGIVAGAAGLYLSYYADVAAGAAVALCLVAFWILATAREAAATLTTRRRAAAAAGLSS
ncbi:MAG: metal ABC transporter permease [Solirubrobacteraceae bacterium]